MALQYDCSYFKMPFGDRFITFGTQYSTPLRIRFSSIPEFPIHPLQKHWQQSWKKGVNFKNLLLAGGKIRQHDIICENKKQYVNLLVPRCWLTTQKKKKKTDLERCEHKQGYKWRKDPVDRMFSATTFIWHVLLKYFKDGCLIDTHVLYLHNYSLQCQRFIVLFFSLIDSPLWYCV